MEKPIILLTCSRREKDGRTARMLNADYSRCVAEAGGVPVAAVGGDAEAYARMADGLLLTGGVDLDPARFGEGRLPGVEVDRERDEEEIALFRAFFKEKKPILGICRGIQLIGVAMGGSLWQDLPAQRQTDHGGGRIHEVTTEKDSLLYRLTGGKVPVNSYHHQAVKNISAGLRVTARADDGVVEGIEHEDGPVLGVQWHPERMEHGQTVFRWLAEEALRRRRAEE